MDGWIPSLILLSMAQNSIAVFDKDYFLKALSVAQLRPAVGTNTYGKDVFCWPLLQIYQHEEKGRNYWFGRLHPQLRRADAQLQLDGSINRNAQGKSAWQR